MEEVFLKLTEKEKQSYFFKYIINETDKYKISEFIKFLSHQGIKYFLLGLFALHLKNNINYINEERYKYYYTFNVYNSILNKFKKLTIELKLDNSLKIADLYTYLLWNGYFSITRENNFVPDNRANIKGLYSYDLVSGVGLCLNHSDLLKDLLNACGFKACNLVAEIQELERSYTPNINRDITNQPHDSNFLTTKYRGNHLFTLIKENNEFYIYDSTNLAFYKVIKQNRCRIINGTGEFRTFSINSYLFNFTEQSKEVLNEFIMERNFTQPYTFLDFKKYFEEILETVNSNHKLIEDYYKDIYDNLFSINDVIEGVKRAKILK